MDHHKAEQPDAVLAELEAKHGSLKRAGSVAGVESEVCGDCEGKGVVLKTNGWMLFDGKCKRCSGTGRVEVGKPLNDKVSDGCRPRAHDGTQNV